MAGAAVLVTLGAWLIACAPRREAWTDPATPPPEFATALQEFDAGNHDAGQAGLRKSLERWKSPVWERRARDLSAFRAAERQEHGAALQSLELRRADGADDPLAGAVAALRADLLLRLNRPAEAVPAAVAAGALEPAKTVFGEDALAVWVRATDPAEGAETLKRLIGTQPLRAPERFALLRAELMPAERRAEALKAVWLRHPGTAAAAEVIAKVDEAGSPGGGWNESDLPLFRDRALGLMRADDPAEAQATWELAKEKISSPATEALIRAGLGAAQAARGDTRAAAALLPARVSDPALATELAIARGRLALARGRLAEAAAALRPAMSASVPSADRARAHLLLAEALDDAGRDSEALGRYRSGLALVPPLPATDPLRWKAAVAAMRTGRSIEAASLLAPLDRDDAHPGYQAASLFWRARLAEAAKKPADARKLYQETHSRFRNDYYGIRAAVRLGAAPAPTARIDGPRPAAPGAIPDAPPAPLRPEAFPPAAREAVAAGAEFEILGLRPQAAKALEFGVRASAGGTGARALRERLAELALARGDRIGASEHVRAAWPELVSEALPAMPRRFAELLYPTAAPGGEASAEAGAGAGAVDLLVRESLAAGIDPNLARGLILQESAWDPRAVSRAGALGWMQVLPDTGRELARLLGMPRPEREAFFDPAVNVRLGTRHFSDLLRRYQGRVEPALAAYNAGASRVDRWWPAARGDVERFVEDIPFIETRLYVKRITSARRMYTLLHGAPASR